MPTFREDLHTGHEVPLVETDDIMKGAVTTDKIADGAVDTDQIAAKAVTTEKIADKAVDNGKLDDWCVDNRTLGDKAVDNRVLDSVSVDNRVLDDEAVDNRVLANEAVTAEKLSGHIDPETGMTVNAAVTESKIQDGAVTTDKISGGNNPAVTREKIADGAVNADKLSSVNDPEGAAVTAGKIAAGAVHHENLGQECVQAGNIADHAVHDVNLSGSYNEETHTWTTPPSVTSEKLSGVGDTHGPAVTTDKLSGNMIDGEWDTPPAVTSEKIATGAVTTDKLSGVDSEAGAAVTEDKIANLNVTESKIAAGAVTTDKISGGLVDGVDTPPAVTTNKIADYNVTTAKIADSNVTGEKIADGAITEAKIDPALWEYWEEHVDAAPTVGSVLPVQSGGVLDSIIKDGSAFDLSAYTGDSYASLSAALTAMNALSAAYKKGGMSIKYVSTYDNKYVQYRLMSQTFSTTENDWQGVDDEPTTGSENLVKSGGVSKEIGILAVNLGNDISTPVAMTSGYIKCGGSSGTVVDTSPVAHQTYTHAIIDCSAGDVFYIQGKGGSNDRLYCWIDSENKIVNNSSSSLDLVEPTKIVAPQNAVKLIINDENTGRVSYKGELAINKNITVVPEETISVSDFIRKSSGITYGTIAFSSGYIDADLDVGETINLTPKESTAGTEYCLHTCTENDYFYLYNIKQGRKSRAYCFIDSNNKVIAVSSNIISPHTCFIKAPKRTVKVLFQRNDSSGFVYKIKINDKIYKKYYPSGGYIDGDGYHVGSIILFFNNENIQFYPSNSGSILSPSNNGFVVFNITTNLVRFEESSSNILPEEYILDFYYAKNNSYYGGSLSEKTNAIRLGDFTKSVDLYLSPDVSFEDNTITLEYCIGVVNGTYVTHYLKVDGVVTKQTFTFNENGYLVYNSKTFTARYVNTLPSLGKDEFVWIYWRNGNVVGGLLMPQYLKHKITLIEDIRKDNIIYKRAQQLFNIEWTAKDTIANTSSTDGIVGGKHIGIPYTSCMEIDKFVGWDVSIKTFMTAANNKYSLLYTEDLKRNVSGYGFTYHGNRGTIGGYMGIVCNIFALYAVGLPIPYDTGNWDYLRQLGVIKKLDEQDFKYAEIGDLVWEPGHGNVIIDVVKDDNENVISVTWAESTMDFPSVSNKTVAQANNRLASMSGVIYRVVGIEKYKYYEKNKFVASAGETLEPYEYNNDICTFAGDYATFRKGQIIYLNYNLDTIGIWDSIEIYKNNVLLEMLNIDTSEHKIDLTPLNLDYGMYKARMKYENEYSDYTYFEILETQVTLSHEGNNMKVNFSSANGSPDYIRLCKIDGGPVCIIPVSEDDISNGTKIFTPQFYIDKQGYSALTGGTYLKVHFKGKYGCVTNEPILTNI